MQSSSPQQPESQEQRPSWAKRFLPIPTIIVLILGFCIFFMGDHSLVSRMRYEHTIDSLRVELKAQEDTMLYYKHLNESLEQDPGTMEHIVREHYNMKHDYEDVFVFENSTK